MKESNSGRAEIWRAGRFTWDLSEKALIMGILNVTPDSFSDGGSFHALEAAVDHAHQMITEGADILDIGGESTRPGSLSVSIAEELERTIPVIERIREESDVCLSIDTSKPEVARAALAAGVDVINDVTGFRDAEMRDLCASSDCGLVAMHMQGTPDKMQEAPRYEDVFKEVEVFFKSLSRDLSKMGVDAERVVYDPGIGFGKELAHNVTLLRKLEDFGQMGRPLLMGVSRKSFIAALLKEEDLKAREFPTVALTAYTLLKGARIHRVHSVKANAEALTMLNAIVH